MSDGHLATTALESDAVDATEARQLLSTTSGHDPSSSHEVSNQFVQDELH
jgi:hypothetical protein